MLLMVIDLSNKPRQLRRAPRCYLLACLNVPYIHLLIRDKGYYHVDQTLQPPKCNLYYASQLL